MTANVSIVTLQRVIDIALAKGFTQDQAQALAAVASSEGTPPAGKSVIQGDFSGGVPTSFGPFQFHIGGQLNNFAVWLHNIFGHTVDLGTAADVANSNQELAVSYAMDTYLGNAIRNGTAKGLSGAALAEFASLTGQGSDARPGACGNPRGCPQNASKAFVSLFGSGGGTTDTPTTVSGLSSDIAHEVAGQVGVTIPSTATGGTDSGGFNIGPLKLPSGLIALLVGLMLLIVGALLTYTTIEKPSVNVKLPSKTIGQ